MREKARKEYIRRKRKLLETKHYTALLVGAVEYAVYISSEG